MQGTASLFPQLVEKVHPLPRGEGGPEGVGRGLRAETQKSAPSKDLQKSWFLDENAREYLDFLCPKFPPDFLFSLASLDSFPPGEAIGCCRTRGFIDSLREQPGCSLHDITVKTPTKIVGRS